MALRIGTRGSELALCQARQVARALAPFTDELPRLSTVETRGDRLREPLTPDLGRSFFTKEIEDALLEERVDVAVHSLKDLAVEPPPGLCLAAVPERAAAGERLLVHPQAYEPDAAGPLPLRRGACVGTGSPRRRLRLLELRPDLRVEALRGNVPTRVERLREGRCDALLLARAGLERLGLAPDDLEAVDLDPDEFPGAPGQGALGLQCRAGEGELRQLLSRIEDPGSAEATRVERALLQALGGGCSLPLGARAEVEPGRVRLVAFLFASEGEASRWARVEGGDPAALVAEAARGLGPPAGASGSG